jgi:hypothetical protein
MDLVLFLIVFFSAYIIAVILSVPIHEAGHLVFGLLTGYTFLSFRLLSFVWIKEDGKVVLKKSRNGIITGQCLMTPPAREEDFKFILYNAGGGLLNLLCFLITLVLFIFLHGNDKAECILLAFVTANLMMGILNLLPIGSKMPNDGYNIYKATRSPEAAHGIYIMLHVNAETAVGKRYRDYDESEFTVTGEADLTNIFIAYIIMCEAARLYDLGRYADSISALQRIPVGKMQLYYRNSIFTEFIYDALVRNPDIEKAKALYAKKGMDRLMRVGMPTILRVQTAYSFFAKNDKAEAEDYLNKAKASLNTFENKGVCIMEADYIRELEALMEL